jgi:hypothetical protein
VTFDVRYNIGTYTGIITVNAEDEAMAIAKARRRVRQQILPHGLFTEGYSIERSYEVAR